MKLIFTTFYSGIATPYTHGHCSLNMERPGYEDVAMNCTLANMHSDIVDCIHHGRTLSS